MFFSVDFSSLSLSRARAQTNCHHLISKCESIEQNYSTPVGPPTSNP